MNTGHKDARGNEIIIGNEYCVPVHGTSQVSNTKIFGIAVKVMNGKRGVKITMQMTRVEAYTYGELTPSHQYYNPITTFEQLQKEPQAGSYYPTFMFPTGKSKADYA